MKKNKMYEYLEEHAYISKNKKSNYQFELSNQRAKCIANKYNNLVKKLEEENIKYKQVIDKIKEWKNQTLFDLNRQYKTFEYWEELFEDLDKILEEIE